MSWAGDDVIAVGPVILICLDINRQVWKMPLLLSVIMGMTRVLKI